MNFEVGLNVGATWFLGDLGGARGEGSSFLKDTNFKLTKPILGPYFRFHLNEFLSFGVNVNFGQLEGSDAAIKPRSDTSPEFYRYIRNLHFISNFYEGHFLVEFHPINLELLSGDFLQVYGAVGLGFFHFNPKTKYVDPLTGQEQMVQLQPLGTEGQGLPETGRSKYNLTELNIPMGVGVRWILRNKFVFGFEALHRMTATDYIDDVSTIYADPAWFYSNYETPMADMIASLARRSVEIDPDEVYGRITEPGKIRGDSSDNDSYYSFTVKFGIMFGAGSLGYKGGCPKF